jgi:hypothetical protein
MVRQIPSHSRTPRSVRLSVRAGVHPVCSMGHRAHAMKCDDGPATAGVRPRTECKRLTCQGAQRRSPHHAWPRSMSRCAPSHCGSRLDRLSRHRIHRSRPTTPTAVRRARHGPWKCMRARRQGYGKGSHPRDRLVRLGCRAPAIRQSGKRRVTLVRTPTRCPMAASQPRGRGGP